MTTDKDLIERARIRAEDERIQREIFRALSDVAILVPLEEYEPFVNFARMATLRRIREKEAPPITDVDGHFRALVEVYLMNVPQTGKVLH